MKKHLLLFVVVSLCFAQGLNAQGHRKYEVGVSGSWGFSMGKTWSNNYAFDLYGGYKFNGHFSAGLGIGYINYFGRKDLPSGDANIYVDTKQYHAFRPFVYARYDFLPEKKWTPYVSARVGGAFFSVSQLMYRYQGKVESGMMYGGIPAEYEYLLTDSAHPLTVKNNVFAGLDAGASLHVGDKGSKFSFGISADFQPVKFEYGSNSASRINFTIGPKVGFTF